MRESGENRWAAFADEEIDAIWRILMHLGAGGLRAGLEANVLADEIEAEKKRRRLAHATNGQFSAEGWPSFAGALRSARLS